MSANKLLPNLSPEAQQAIKEAGLDSIINSPLQSSIIRAAVIGGVTMIATKVFKIELDAQQAGEYAELAVLALTLGFIIVDRWRKKRGIKSVEETVEMFHSAMVAQAPVVQRDILAFAEKKNPELHAKLVQLLQEVDEVAPEVSPQVQKLAQNLLKIPDAGLRRDQLAGLKEVLDTDTYNALVAYTQALGSPGAAE